jgi:hypothetical protein
MIPEQWLWNSVNVEFSGRSCGQGRFALPALYEITGSDLMKRSA